MLVDMLKRRSMRYFLHTILMIFVSVSLWAQSNSEVQLANHYFQQGEYDKAFLLYEKLEKNSRNIPLIHENYFQLMLLTGRLEKAEKYIEKVNKKFPANILYQIDKGIVYQQQDKKNEAKKQFEKIIDFATDDPFKTRIAAQHFTKNQLYGYAIETYRLSRKKMKDPRAYSIQMASIYRLLNEKQNMINEYLNYVNQFPNNLRSVKNILQNVLRDEDDLALFEQMMYDKVQQAPNNTLYNELLVWVNVQRKNFYSAFIQARALDKRNKLNGNQLMQIGQIAMQNKDYKNAISIFEYVIKQYEGTVNYQISRRLIITCREEMVKNSYPVDEKQIRTLIKDYRNLVADIGLNQNTAEALRSEALLYAFYLNQHDSAIAILKKIISQRNISKSIVNRSKLDLGDIYLLTGQPWESTLLYSQVEKSSKDTPIAYEAKLRNAKLAYYRGDFALAQSHLDILKLATSREIANDAMALSLLIKDNTRLDTSDVAMKTFADVDLLIFQNKKKEAYTKLEELKFKFPDHPLFDEIIYRQATLKMEMGDFENAVLLLQQLVDKYGEDILGDDAMFLMATIYDDQLSDKEKALEIYQSFLKRYPGSNKAAEARRRFRKLRGDFM